MQPGAVVPMKLTAAREVPNGNFIYQLKWDGVRMLSFLNNGNLVLQNRQLKLRTAQYPELDILFGLFRGREAVLDGEIVVLRDELCTCFRSVLRRDSASEPKTVRALRQELPIHYVVFDILSLNGWPLLTRPLEERLELLKEHLSVDASTVSIVESFPHGDSLFAAARQMKLEGIVAKERVSPYLPGERTKLWQKIKHKLKDVFAILGYTTRQGYVNALVLGFPLPEGGYRLAGRAGSGLNSEQVHVLTRELPKLRLPNAPRGFPSDAVPVHPSLQAEVEFMEWTDDLLVRAPAIKGFSVRSEYNGS